MAATGPQGDWADQLERNEHGLKILTFANARAMAAAGERVGWYVAPFATKWTVGRKAGNSARYHIVTDDREPLVFDTVWQAKRFLSTLVAAAVQPRLAGHRFTEASPARALEFRGKPAARTGARSV
jgi:hypothetical protein